jgi:Peptidase family M1 domain
MRSSTRGLVFLILTCIQVACSSGQASQPAPILTAATPSWATAEVPSEEISPVFTSRPALETLAVTSPATNPFSTTTPANQTGQRPQYHLTAELDYDRHFLSVKQIVLYTNRVHEPIPDLLLLVEPSRYPGAFHLTSLALDGGSPVDDYQREIGSFRVPLSEPLSPGDTLQISLEYEISIPSPDPAYYGKPVPFGYSERQTNLVDWYPFLPPYIPGSGWLAHPVAPFGEYLVYESSDFQVDLRLQSAGRNLIVAASALPEEDGEWRHYVHEGARTFAWSVSDQYQVSSTRVGSTEILSYAFPINAEAGRAALEATAEALALYADLYGPYPHRSLSVVEADFLDGMEYDGLYFLSKGFYNLYSGSPADYLTAIAAHETAHMWWYGLVGNDQALAPWLDEALCTYSERLYYENLHPEVLDWWWAYRVNYYEPKGWVDGSVYNPEGYRSYRDAVYLNGALFLEDLRKQIGDQAFFAFLPAYAKKFALQIASTDQFFDLLGEFSSVDLAPLESRYFQKR